MFGLTLDINKEKYTKLSAVLFPVVLRVANFLLSLFCSVISLLCRKPVVWIFSTNYARSFFYYGSQFGGVLFLLLFLSVLNFWGMLLECTLRSYRVLHFYQRKTYNYNTCSLYKLMPLLYNLSRYI